MHPITILTLLVVIFTVSVCRSCDFNEVSTSTTASTLNTLEECPEFWSVLKSNDSEFPDRCTLFFNLEINYQKAIEFCEDNNSTLFVPNTLDDLMSVADRVHNKEIWIGAKREYRGGAFFKSDGTMYFYPVWSPLCNLSASEFNPVDSNCLTLETINSCIGLTGCTWRARTFLCERPAYQLYIPKTEPAKNESQLFSSDQDSIKWIQNKLISIESKIDLLISRNDTDESLDINNSTHIIVEK